MKLLLKGQIYFNNSIIPLEEINIGDNALLCMTSNPNCCAGPNRIGEFYFPNGDQVPRIGPQNGFYRDRSDQIIRLNRLEGVTTPTGRYQCELPNSAGVLQNISFTLSRKLRS